MFIAGTDTPSIALSWSIYFLSQYPAVLAEVRAEVDEVFDDIQRSNSSGTPLSKEAILNRLTLCHACFTEAMRLCGPAAILQIEAVDKTSSITLMSGTLIRPTDKLWLSLDALKYNAEVFPDPMTFNPSRWLTSDQEALAQMEYYNLNFGFGPRVCPGMQVTAIEGPFVIAHIAHALDIQLACPAAEVIRVAALTISPSKMPIIFTKRVK